MNNFHYVKLSSLCPYFVRTLSAVKKGRNAAWMLHFTFLSAVSQCFAKSGARVNRPIAQHGHEKGAVRPLT